MCFLLGKPSLITGFARFGMPSSITPFGESITLEVLKPGTEREVIFPEQDQAQFIYIN